MRIGRSSESVQTAANMSQMKGQPDWPAYARSRRATMLINAGCKVVDDPFGLEKGLWENPDP